MKSEEILDYDKLHSIESDKKTSYLNVDEQWSEIKDYILENVDTNSKILEIGSGGGFFSNWLYKSGYKNVLVTDCSKVALGEIKRRFPYLKTQQLNAENFNFKENFDVIISLDLIEHLKDVNKHLKSVNNSLNKYGIYIVKTPNKTLENIYYKKFLLKNDVDKKHPWWKAHISLMTKNELNNKLDGSGFKTNFLRSVELTNAQEKKVKIMLGSLIGSIVIVIIDFFIKIIPKKWGVQFIGVATKR